MKDPNPFPKYRARYNILTDTYTCGEYTWAADQDPQITERALDEQAVQLLETKQFESLREVLR